MNLLDFNDDASRVSIRFVLHLLYTWINQFRCKLQFNQQRYTLLASKHIRDKGYDKDTIGKMSPKNYPRCSHYFALL